jgi:hypothetical protein
MPEVTQTGRNFVARLHEWQSLLGTIIGAVVNIFLAVLVIQALTVAMKRTDFFLNFTTRYHGIRVDAHALHNSIIEDKRSSLLAEGDAHQIYFRLFGLIYDEIQAYHDGFLAKDVLVEWITWQMYDRTEGKFEIGGVSYEDGWQWWLTTPGKHSPYTPMLEDIFARCKERKCVQRDIETKISPSWLPRIL